MGIDISVNIGDLKLKNPVMAASGTFGYAEDYVGAIHELPLLGAIITKTITLNPRRGNPPPRTCETPAGLLNSIGLENPGIEIFLEEKLPKLSKLGTPIIVSIASEGNPEEFVILAKRLDKIKEVAAIELNISCPNIKHKIPSPPKGERVWVRGNKDKKLPPHLNLLPPSGGEEIKGLMAQNPKATRQLVSSVRKVTGKTLITKLSPNVTDITEIAKAAEAAGSDAVSLINTLMGMSIDIDTKKPKLWAVTGGLSGPAIRPVAVRMVWEAKKAVKIPVIGIGGIMTAQDALEFIIAGATAVQVGTANFINPRTVVDIIEELTKYLKENKINRLKDLTGSIKI